MAISLTLIETVKVKGITPHAWLTWVLSCIANHEFNRLDGLMRWSYAGQAA
ncbi:MAG: transposase domain-containing protein [Pseudomonadota bacterium]